jgi:integrase
MDQALFLWLLRCGLRGSEVAHRNGRAIDGSQQAWRIAHGKGRKDRQVDRSADAVER